MPRKKRSQRPPRPADRDLLQLRLGRSTALAMGWEDGQLICENYLSGVRAEINAPAVDLLEAFSKPRSVRTFVDDGFGGLPKRELLRVLRQWLRFGFLEKTRTPAERALESWHWGQSARHFLFATKNAHRYRPRKQRVKYAKRLFLTARQPPLYKHYRGKPRVKLARPRAFASESNRTLAGNRSCRAYRLRPLSKDTLSEILSLTWGEMRKLDSRPFPWGPLIEKTSYSGGYRNPVEVYPVVVSVAGVAPGLYHYNVKNHSLELLKRGRFAPLVRRIGARQEWIRNASVYFLMTAVFARTMFKYRHEFALRAVFMDVGHLSQSLHLAARGLGLGAASTSGLDHTLGESFLGVDGVNESLLCLSMAGRPV